MTPYRRFRHDVRSDALALWHRKSVTLPCCIQPDGTAATDQIATIPPGIDLLLAALPHRECGEDPASWTGAALVGTREPDLSACTPGHAILADTYGNSGIVTAQGRHAILAWLFRITGFRYAPAALWKLAGWRIGWVATFLDQLQTGGAEGALIVALRQTEAAIRQMWLALDQPKASSEHLAASGAVLAGRALIDLVAALDRILDQMTGPDLAVAQITAVRRIRATLAYGLERYCRYLAEADRASQASPGQLELTKLKGALKVAQAITHAVALFAVASDRNDDVPTDEKTLKPLKPIKARIAIIGHKLSSTKVLMGAPGTVALGFELDRLNDELNRLASGAPPSWRTRHHASLARLNSGDRTARMAALDQIRTDLIYQLIVTRRLDQVYRVLPWMAALSDVFPGVLGGPLGAIAQLFEAGRAREIALELIRRLYDEGDAARLDTRKGKKAIGTSASMARQVATETRAGFLLAEGALSYHMAQAHLAGQPFDKRHPIPVAAAGSLDWEFPDSLSDHQTAVTVRETERSKAIYAAKAYERDLPRYMGLALVPMLGKAITDIFLGRLRGPGFYGHVATIHEIDEMFARFMPESMTSGCGVATRELMRSVLKSLDVEDDADIDEWRSDDKVLALPRTRELNRADKRLTRHKRKDKNADGGAIRRTASQADKAAGSPADGMWRLIDRARTWTVSEDGVTKSEDEPFELVIEGHEHPPGLVPLGAQFMYPLWFAPNIDRHRLAWLADGAPLHSPVAFGDLGHAGLIAQAVAAMRSSAPRLYADAAVDRVIIDVMTTWFTGLSNIAADHAHVR